MTCPNCGYCPHCGRGASPYIQQPYQQPYPSFPWNQPQITWGGTSSLGNATGGLGSQQGLVNNQTQ